MHKLSFTMLAEKDEKQKRRKIIKRTEKLKIN